VPHAARKHPALRRLAQGAHQPVIPNVSIDTSGAFKAGARSSTRAARPIYDTKSCTQNSPPAYPRPGSQIFHIRGPVGVSNTKHMRPPAGDSSLASIKHRTHADIKDPFAAISNHPSRAGMDLLVLPPRFH